MADLMRRTNRSTNHLALSQKRKTPIVPTAFKDQENLSSCRATSKDVLNTGRQRKPLGEIKNVKQLPLNEQADIRSNDKKLDDPLALKLGSRRNQKTITATSSTNQRNVSRCAPKKTPLNEIKNVTTLPLQRQQVENISKDKTLRTKSHIIASSDSEDDPIEKIPSAPSEIIDNCDHIWPSEYTAKYFPDEFFLSYICGGAMRKTKTTEEEEAEMLKAVLEDCSSLTLTDLPPLDFLDI